jgi:hypothetical protein
MLVLVGRLENIASDRRFVEHCALRSKIRATYFKLATPTDMVHVEHHFANPYENKKVYKSFYSFLAATGDVG